MKRTRIIATCITLALSFIFLACLPLGVLAAESPGEKAIGSELTRDVGMPILDGGLWMKMAPESKVAFVWGVWHVASIEGYLMGKYPDLKKDNFSAKIMESSSRKPMAMNEVVAVIDNYYQTNPDQIKKPVMAVIWTLVVKPNVETGIVGSPLNR